MSLLLLMKGGEDGMPLFKQPWLLKPLLLTLFLSAIFLLTCRSGWMVVMALALSVVICSARYLLVWAPWITTIICTSAIGGSAASLIMIYFGVASPEIGTRIQILVIFSACLAILSMAFTRYAYEEYRKAHPEIPAYEVVRRRRYAENYVRCQLIFDKISRYFKWY